MFMNVYWVGICAFTWIPQKLALETLCYSATAFATLANAGIYLNQRRNVAKFAFNIEWDIDLEEFVVKMPAKTYGGIKELRVSKEDFQMLKEDDKDCLYFDAKTGTRFATVNRGMWYN